MDVNFLWEKYKLPEKKRIHSTLVAQVAVDIAKKLQAKGVEIDVEIVENAALLHDIDKAVEKLPGERHPDSAVRILRSEGLDALADIVKTHSLHLILDENTAPQSWEQKVLYLADKMVKQEIVGVDKRFALWMKEDLPTQAKDELTSAYPKVKTLEKQLLSI